MRVLRNYVFYYLVLFYISSRIISSINIYHLMNMTIIQIYAHTHDYADEEVELYY